MAEQFLANHQNNHPELPQDMPSQIEKPEIRSLEAKLDHSNPYVRLEAAEALVKGRSDSGFPWLKVVEVLKKLLALPDDRRDLLSLAYDLLSSKDLAGVDRILSEPQAIRARAARALDELNPGWDREMVDQNSI
jgi:hypothetical protein